MESIEIGTIYDDLKAQQYQKDLTELRAQGATRVNQITEKIYAIKTNKSLSKETRRARIAELQQKLEEAKKIAKENRPLEKKISAEAVQYVNKTSKGIEKEITLAETAQIKEKKLALKEEITRIKKESSDKIKEIKASFANNKAQLQIELDLAEYELKSAIFDSKRQFENFKDQKKAAIFQAYVDRTQLNRSLRHGKTNYVEDQTLKIKGYRQNFKAKAFFLKNGLYIALIIFFIVCVVLAPQLTGGSQLLSLPNILTILEQASTRMFYALGVAGLILLGGTDLSIGRQIAMGSIMTGLILHPGRNIVTFFGMGPWDFSALPMFARLVMALLISISLCVVFSIFAGWFCAKLKMHPFVATLSTQLIIYGLLFYGTRGTPVGSIDRTIKDLIGGRWVLGRTGAGLAVTFPKLIIPAIVAIIVAWFIWNKTTFGKYMYAVGDNSEAASVSGISVFKTTLLVFAMAGVFYGFGSFFEAFRANASAGTGQGYELDAIAACVVGGISFNGGIGKISGAVVGVLIFTALTYCLTFLGIDTNLQFVFKGLILIVAVAMDSLKYLKRT